LTITSWLVRGLPRQFWLMNENSRCSILFHLLEAIGVVHLQLTINRDAYPTNRSGFSLGHYGYYSGNMIAEAGSYSNCTAANLYHAEEAGLPTGCTVTTQAVDEHPLRQRQSVLTRRHKGHQEDSHRFAQHVRANGVMVKQAKVLDSCLWGQLEGQLVSCIYN